MSRRLATLFVGLVLTVLAPRSVEGEVSNLVDLGEGRYLVARPSPEGMILHFQGERSSDDDRVVLLPNRQYVADAQWVEGAGVVALLAGAGEIPIDLYGYSQEGQRLFRSRTQQEEAELLQPLPGDLLLAVCTRWLGSQPTDVFRARTGEPVPAQLPDGEVQPDLVAGEWLPLDDGTAVTIEHDEDLRHVSLRSVTDRAVIKGPTDIKLDPGVASYVASATGVFFASAARDSASGINLVALNRETWEIHARTWLPGQDVTLVAEPGGGRLLAWVVDLERRGHIVVLDQTNLALQDTLPNPDGWWIDDHPVSGTRRREGVGMSLVTGAFPVRDETAPPRAMAVSWGDTIGIRFIGEPAALARDGGLIVAREFHLEGNRREIRIERWEPPGI